MGLRTIIVPAALGATLAAVPSCREQTFACSSDSQCQQGASMGWCEASGSCSVSDPECPSERRYSEFATGGLAGTCVPVEDAGTSAGSESANDTVADADPTEASDDADGSGDAEGTGVPPAACGGGLTEEFAGRTLGSQWGAFGFLPGQEDWVEVVAGALQISLPPDVSGYAGIAAVDVFQFDNGSVRMEFEGSLGPATVVIISVGTTESETAPLLLLYLFETDAEFARLPEGGDPEPLSDSVPLSVADTPWVELGFSTDGEMARVSVATSADGVDFDELVSVVHEVPLNDSLLFVYASSFDPTALPGDVVRINALEVCAP